MLNAREDHVEEFLRFHLRRLFQEETGCTWVAVQNEIAI